MKDRLDQELKELQWKQENGVTKTRRIRAQDKCKHGTCFRHGGSRCERCEEEGYSAETAYPVKCPLKKNIFHEFGSRCYFCEKSIPENVKPKLIGQALNWIIAGNVCPHNTRFMKKETSCDRCLREGIDSRMITPPQCPTVRDHRHNYEEVCEYCHIRNTGKEFYRCFKDATIKHQPGKVCNLCNLGTYLWLDPCPVTNKPHYYGVTCWECVNDFNSKYNPKRSYSEEEDSDDEKPLPEPVQKPKDEEVYRPPRLRAEDIGWSKIKPRTEQKEPRSWNDKPPLIMCTCSQLPKETTNQYGKPRDNPGPQYHHQRCHYSPKTARKTHTPYTRSKEIQSGRTHWCRFRMRYEDPRQKCKDCLHQDFRIESQSQEKPKSRIPESLWKVGQEKAKQDDQAMFIGHLEEKEISTTIDSSPQIGVFRVHPINPKIKIPKPSYEGDIGFNLQAKHKISIPPLSRAVVGTGLGFVIPKGHKTYYGQIYPRSGLALGGLSTDAGTIDPNFKGEVIIVLVNCNRDRWLHISQYDEVAQIVFHRAYNQPLVEVSQPIKESTTRGTKGFGSSGGVHAVQKKIITEFNEGTDPKEKFAYNIGKDIGPEREEQIHILMEKYQHILAVSFEDIEGSTLHHKHDIDTGDAKPTRRSPYPLSHHYKDWLDAEIKRMLAARIISPTNSPWASPVVIVSKKAVNGKSAPRLCIDYGDVNQKTVKDAHPIPRTQLTLEQMQGNPRYFTSLDLFSGFHQIGMTERAKQRSAFVTPFGHYHYNRMPFGLCNAPATFQRVMNNMFRDMIGKVLFVYIDDITIYTKTFQEHMAVLEEVLRRIKNNGMSLKPKKCTIAAQEVHLLGHIINRDGIKTDPAKISAVKDYPAPESKTEVRAFMGLVNYYRHFITNCSEISEPINRTLKKDVRFQWTDEAQAAFEKLKDLLTKAPVLARPNMNKPFRLHTDASKLGLGAVLTQDFEIPGRVDKKGKPLIKERVISYASRSNHNGERNYGATQLEQLAVVWAIDHYRHYLHGRPFQVITDHQALKSLMKMKDPKGIYARWIMRLQPYDIDMVYKPGRKHGNADALSRRPHRVTFVERLPKGPAWRETY